MTSSPPKITLYTNRLCPWAHRAHIALQELNLPYEEVTIDLSKPREPWYLEINPRGLVPSLSYNDKHIITESAIVVQFLADINPTSSSHALLPPSGTEHGALYRARAAFFVDTFVSKVLPFYHAGQRSSSTEERDKATEGLVGAVVKEVEPLLQQQAELEGQGQGPFFGGSEKLTLVEVLTGSFLLRILSYFKPKHGLLSPSLNTQLEERAPLFKRWAEATVNHPSVTSIWDEEKVVGKTKEKLALLAAAAAAKSK